MVSETERAIIAARLGIYQRANALVTVGLVPVLTHEQESVQAQQIVALGDHALLEAASVAAAFEKFDGRAGEMVPANAPMMVIKALEQRVGRFKFPLLAGIVNAPTMRADGSILAAPGWDKRTALLFDPVGVEFPAIPERPSQTMARAALDALLEMIAGFPFVGEADRAVALSVILTSCIRRALRTAPLHGFTAPTPGTGKSKIVDLSSVISTGREAGVVAMGANPEEMEKRLGALLMAGSAIAIDNVEATLGSDLLCQILTQTTVRPRILGKSETPELPTNVLVTATGNNLVLGGDMTRRGLLCRLDAGVERPELRTFDFDPVERAKAERGRLVVAALTVLRAYQHAGRPAQKAPLGSFEEWSRTVRDALLWLDCADPVDTMESARALDPKMERLRAVMVTWREVIGSERVTLSEVVQRASEKATPSHFDPNGKAPFLHPEFRDALLAVGGAGGFVDAVKLGTWLGRNKNRVLDGDSFEADGSHKGTSSWRLNSAKAPAQRSSSPGSASSAHSFWDGGKPRF
ncbi:hypothetical protein [Lichenibacterium dinghuense]|uniref:hypothetical protein n=1 Tax=Lichenibacterium dinghuense TaxID=2895977 RepID=UPI001F29341B|nr:hypothetical protein [Lichenibacterium sp. 6Y81]